MTTPKTINYVFNDLQEAVRSYHECLGRLERWSIKYPNYDFDINLLTSGIKRLPTVRVTIIKHKR
jgi:hypothetical protein